MIGLWFVLGTIFGVLNGLAQWWAIARLGLGASPSAAAWVAGRAVLYWVLVAGLLVAALQQGIGPGLLAFAGLWLGRWIPVGWAAWRAGRPDVSQCEG